MNHSPLPLIIALAFFIVACNSESTANDEVKVAGRTLAGWTTDLESTNEIVRLRAVKSLGPFKEKAIDALAACLTDSSDAVKYWAADHLGSVGKQVAQTESHQEIAKRLEALAKDEKKAVSLAAAYALFQINGTGKNLDRVIEKLRHPVRGVACSAAEFLGKIGPKAKASLAELESQFKNHKDYHVRGACQNAIRKIKGQPVM